MQTCNIIIINSPHPPKPIHMHNQLHANLQLRNCRIENELDQIRELPWAQVIQCAPKGIERVDVWILWVPGRTGTIWQGGQYPVQITFPEQYPHLGPRINFENDFKHVHVYNGGAICLPLIETQYWRSKTNMSDLLQRIINLIHQDINPYSPANMQVFQLYKSSLPDYQSMIKEQALKYSKKGTKYFEQPCIHINALIQQ